MRRMTLRAGVALLTAILLGATALLPAGQTPTLAQGAPPELGEVVLEDALSTPGVVQEYACPSGRAGKQFANDGLTFTISGGCQSAEGFPGHGIDLGQSLTFADGEVRVELRQLDPHDRTQVQIFLRSRNAPGFSAYVLALNPRRGTLQLGVSVDGQYKQLVQRNDLASILNADDWITLAFRAQGPSFWAFVNEQQTLSATDSSLPDVGGANPVVSRIGQPNAADTHEVSAVLRNLRVSALQGGEQARAPVYRPPLPIVTVSNVPCTQPTALPSDITLVPPPDGLDPAITRLAGAWEGVWDADSANALPSRLYVEQVAASTVTLVYTWGVSPGNVGQPGWQRYTVDVQPDGKFGWGTDRRFTFWATGDESLEGTLEWAQGTSKIALGRCPAL